MHISKEEYSKIIAEIESLPQGGITYKKINGKEYAYYQWREDDVNQDLKYLEANAYRYVFIDEVTLLDDFIEGAALFSDVFAAGYALFSAGSID